VGSEGLIARGFALGLSATAEKGKFSTSTPLPLPLSLAPSMPLPKLPLPPSKEPTSLPKKCRLGAPGVHATSSSFGRSFPAALIPWLWDRCDAICFSRGGGGDASAAKAIGSSGSDCRERQKIKSCCVNLF
jgi:hypothetical protein